MMEPVENLLREVLRIGDERGVTQIRARHLPDAVMADLMQQTHAYALAHAAKADLHGWLIFREGIEPWWREEGGLTKGEFSRVYLLRTDVVKRLTTQGLASRHHPRSTLLYVRRAID